MSLIDGNKRKKVEPDMLAVNPSKKKQQEYTLKSQATTLYDLTFTSVSDNPVLCGVTFPEMSCL